MQIGRFRADGAGFVGRVETLTLDVAVRLIPTGFVEDSRAPDWRVHLDDETRADCVGVEVGSGWTHDRPTTGQYIKLQLDCLGFVRPVRANLLPSKQGEDEYVLLWSPRLRRPKAE